MNLWKSPSANPSRVTSPIGGEPDEESEEAPLEAGSWEDPRQVLPEPPLRDRRTRREAAQQRSTARSRDKRRHGSVTVSVSDEEEAILKNHAASLGTTFSDWARRVLFAAANRKIPVRYRGAKESPSDIEMRELRRQEVEQRMAKNAG